MQKESKQKRIDRTGIIFSKLVEEFPDAHCALNYNSPLELLIATILSAQCTDKNVNRVTRNLFLKYRCARDYAESSLEELSEDIRSIGLYRAKAKNIRLACQSLLENHDGQVPASMKSLIELAGVGRKTANVVLGNIFGINEGVVVDTHVGRIVQLLGLTTEDNPVKIERDLIALVPEVDRTMFSHVLIEHGRKTCVANRPRCQACVVSENCFYYLRQKK
ncbi:MAG: endonuclease III [Candidatus Cloacimonetes bacterium]|nr:endonuclease III [Candidatus Cloacimonadota bacterium]